MPTDVPFPPPTTDYAIPPGETLLELLENHAMSQADLARRTGRPLKTINDIVKGRAAITPETALQLERVFGRPATWWNALEANYRTDLLRLEKRDELRKHVDWLKRFPLREMLKHGLITEFHDNVIQLEQVLSFFGVTDPETWANERVAVAAQFRQATGFEVDDEALAVWLRWGHIEADTMHCGPYDERRFYSALLRARALTVEDPKVFVPEVQKECAAAGVAVVYIPEMPRIRMSGATRWMSPIKAILQLSLRYKSDDALWFTFFHEAGHILLHGKRYGHLDQYGPSDKEGHVNLAGGKRTSTPREEEEANQFAANFLVPTEDYARIRNAVVHSLERIPQIASELGIAPGILVGRLQFDGVIPWNSPYGKLRRRLVWVNEEQTEAETETK